MLVKHIFAYVNDLNPEPSNFIIDLAFTPIKQQLKRDLKKYETIIERNKVNGSKGGRPKKEETQKTQWVNSVNLGNPKEPKKADNDNVDDNVDDNVNEKKVIGRFTPPTPTQVSNYAKEQNKSIDGERFCDFYESKGWMVGKNKMKSWQAAVRNWIKDKDSPNGQQNISLKIGKHPDLI